MIVRQFFSSLSYVFHPILMPLLGVYLLFSIETRPQSYYTLDALFYFPDQAKTFLYVIIGVLTFAAPTLSLLIMYWNKMITSLTLEKREERIYPFILVFFYYLLAYIYARYQIPDELKHPALIGFLFGILIVFAVCFIINFVLKISIHAAAIFGIVGMLIGYSQTQLPPNGVENPTNLFIILYIIIIAGIVAGARLYLKAHTLKEIIFGMLIGFSILFITVKYGVYI